MNDDTKYRDRHIAGVLISRLLQEAEPGITTKTRASWAR